MPGGQTSALSPETAAKYRRVVQLRTAGGSFDEIAEQVGYASRSGSKMAYDRALKWWGNEAVDDLRLIQGERLEQLWRHLFAQILADSQLDKPYRTERLSNAAVNILKHQAALYGLESPKQVEISGQDGAPIITDVGEAFRSMIEEARAATGVIDAQSVNILSEPSQNGLHNGLKTD